MITMSDSREGTYDSNISRTNLVVQGFSRLIRKSSSLGDVHVRAIEAFLAHSVYSKEDLLNQLHSHHLPLLSNQLKTLSLSPIPSGLWKESNEDLELILQTQSDLEHTLDQIKFTIASVCTSPHSQSKEQHLKALKWFRISHLQQRLAPEDLKRQSNRCHYKKRLSNEVYRASKLIELVTIESTQWSDLDLAQEDWESELDKIEQMIRHNITMISPPPNFRQEYEASVRRLTHVPVIRLARLSIPIIKLSKLFFMKISKRGMNQRRLSPYTEMSSNEIDIFSQSVAGVAYHVQILIQLFYHNDMAYSDAASHEFTAVTNQIKNELESALLFILLHFLPLVPDTKGLPAQKYYKTWFVTWKIQFNFSIDNFQQALNEFQNTPS
ncbi:uncharacterized protein PGTG_21725 [Puccinia graminis f. sp. tritici CRL 75-36-700-3]|uniref:Uncharacterized protein n=1 Tax=Puccinia graminis f. sp. tritici (strain CRL 75-36-700-3 / race SCCL) TaxID=418459 RepID=H6QSB1_PUCGT|nr:uncharacterized protein PGTG_21725 [Puccinia graminis f. sp. tritici CRL 75-36-700-3]EHS63635.1 hypothetical protein PGTG_21725 [Puccinia graminis f. sp. tritici CRL 75-36-700-3]